MKVDGMNVKDSLIIVLTIWLALLTLLVLKTCTGMFAFYENRFTLIKSDLTWINFTLSRIENNIELLVNSHNDFMNVTKENFERLYANYRILAEKLGV